MLKWRIELYKEFVSHSTYIATYYPKDTDDKDNLIQALSDYDVQYRAISMNNSGVITQHYTVSK